MNKIRHLMIAAVMTLFFGVMASAGEIHTGVVSPPPPPPQSSVTAETESTSRTAEIPIGGTPNELSTEIVWNLLQLLTVF